MDLKGWFALLDESPDPFLSIGMSSAVTDALSFQFQLCFQSVVEGIGHQFFRPRKGVNVPFSLG